VTTTCIIQTACNSEDTAQVIAEALVDKALAASVTVLPAANTYVAFHGRNRWDEEYQVFIYTTEEKFDAVAEVIKRLHTYETPLILLLSIDRASEESLAWIQAMGGR
jgi:periplasmic divalent cation tolerance protein